MNLGIIGAGATGLTAAYDAVKAGHRVTVLEAAEELGGLAAFGVRAPSAAAGPAPRGTPATGSATGSCGWWTATSRRRTSVHPGASRRGRR